MSSFFRTPRAEHPSGAQGLKTTGRTACALIMGGSLVLPLALPAQAVDAITVPEAIPAAITSSAAVPTEVQAEASVLATQPVASYHGATAESGDTEPVISAVPPEAPIEPALPELPIEAVPVDAVPPEAPVEPVLPELPIEAATAEADDAPAVADSASEATPAAAEEKPKLIAPTHYKGEDLAPGMIRLENGALDLSQPTARITGWMRNVSRSDPYYLILRQVNPQQPNNTAGIEEAHFTMVEVKEGNTDRYENGEQWGSLYYFEMTIDTSALETKDYELATFRSQKAGYEHVKGTQQLSKINTDQSPYIALTPDSVSSGVGQGELSVYSSHFKLFGASSVKLELVKSMATWDGSDWVNEEKILSTQTLLPSDGNKELDDYYNSTLSYDRADILYSSKYFVRATAYAADGTIVGLRKSSADISSAEISAQVRIPAIMQPGKASAQIHLSNVNGYRDSSHFYVTAYLIKQNAATGTTDYIYPVRDFDATPNITFDSMGGAVASFEYQNELITQDGSYTIFFKVGDGDWMYSKAIYSNTFPVENAISSTRPVDAQEDHAYHKELSWAVKQGYMGTVDGAVGPQWNVNRAEVIATLYRLYGSPRVYTSNPYQDIDWRYPHYQAILWATNMGLISPDEQGNFNPGEQVNRQFMLNLLYRLDAFPKEQNPSLQQQLEWAYDLNLVPAQLSTGGGTFGAHQPLSRAELAAFLYLWAPHIS